MLTTNHLRKLDVEDKRRIMRALLERAFEGPRNFPLSYAQEQLWFMDKLQPGSPVYNIPLYVPFQGVFDQVELERALELMIERHDMLRAHFGKVDEQPVQIIEPEVELELEFDDLSKLSGDEQSQVLGVALNQDAQKPFDLSEGVCVRYHLFRLDSTNHLLSVTFHHIITDAWSLGRFVSELNAIYAALRGGDRESPLAPLQVEYSDYARWQRAKLRGLRMTKLLKYWTTRLSGAPHILQLPTDHPRPEELSFRGTVVGFVLDDELAEALLALSREHKVTLFMLMLACYCALLYRYSGQEDMLIGAPVANRDHPELEPIIGLFVNTLILRIQLHESQTFAELVADVQRVCLAAFEHQALPFPKLVDELKVDRTPGYPPLYQVVFNFQNAALIESANPRAEGETMDSGDFPFVHSNTAKVDLNLTVTQNGDKVSGGFEYNTDLFEAQTIDEMIEHYRTIAEQVVGDPSIALMDLSLPTASADADTPEPATGPMDFGAFDFE